MSGLIPLPFPPLSDAQKNVISDNSPVILVSASAGTGKTTVMIEKIISCILSGESLRQMVICTFTNAAAADMKSKLYKRLSELSHYKNELAKKALNELPLAQISTLHSFCQRLIKTHFYACDIDPAFEIMDATEATVVLNECIERTVERFYAQADKDFMFLYEVLLKKREPKALKVLLKKIHTFACVQPSFDGFLESCKGLDRLASELEIDEQNLADPQKTKAYVDVLVDMVKSIQSEYMREKHKRFVLDYTDLEHYALFILTQQTVRQALAQSIKYLFVDEYQDINPVQEKIISLIDANKFFVGDVKQSIYGFRLCDPDIFVQKYRQFKKCQGGSCHDLNNNYRSCDEILSFCNRVFERIMTSEFGKVDYINDASFNVASRDSFNAVKIYIACGEKTKALEPDCIYSVKNHRFSDDEQSLSVSQANLVVSKIFDILSKDKTAKFESIAILLRSVNSSFGANLYNALKKAGIPCFISVPKVADACPDIATLINWLRVIDNSQNDIALAAALTSCIGGFDDNDLMAIRDLHPNGSFFEAALYAKTQLDFALKGRLEGFFEKLEHYRVMSKSVKVSALAGAICSENDYFKYVLAKRDGRIAARELSTFLDLIESSAYNISLYEFLLSIDANMPQITIEPETDCVKIMTIHASKGLEFEHVILANIDYEFSKKDLNGTMLLDKDYGIVLKHFNDEMRVLEPTTLYAAVRRKEHFRRLEEEMRLLYVAMTRAKRTLSIFGAASGKIDSTKQAFEAKNFLEMLAPEVEKLGEFFMLDECLELSAVPKVSVTYRKPIKSAVSKIKEFIEFKYKHSLLPLKASVSAIIDDSADEESDSNVILEYAPFVDTERAAERGSAYHKIMQEFNLDAQNFEVEFERLKAQFPTEAKLVDLNEIMNATQKMHELARGKKFYKELKFIVDVPAEVAGYKNDEDNILVQGIIDFIIIEPSGLTIIDYKTGKLTAQAKNKYARQLDLYAYAAEKILKIKVVKKALYLFKDDCFLIYN